jgi:lysophospholipase L1-like esterase
MQSNSLTNNIGVLNQAAGGNRILLDGLGPNAWSRLDRDVLAQVGVKYAMIFEGVNDIGTGDTTAENQTAIGNQLEQAFRQMSTRLHAFNIPFFASTITPFGGPGQAYSVPIYEQTRQRINTFIRTSGTFDAVIDFDAVVRNPANFSELNPNFDSGDHLHPNVAGYTAMAAVFDLSLFVRFANGVPSTFN